MKNKTKYILISITIIIIISLILLTQSTKEQNQNFNKEQILPKNKMKIKSVFENNQKIPKKYTFDDLNINPPLEIIDIPENTKSLVLIVDDPDAPKQTWVHWIVYNIEPETKKIEENKTNLNQGINSWKNQKYQGPAPPSGTHRYFFKLYAIDTKLNFTSPPTKEEIEDSIKNHIIEKAELIGLYSRNS